MILSSQAELRIFREVDLDILELIEFATLTASNPFVALYLELLQQLWLL